MRDILTVMKKDLREWFMGRESARWTFISIAMAQGVWGVLMPYQMREAWRISPAPAALFMLLPVFMTLAVVADSFAGERERKTLETLLATRLPDSAIFLGKVAAIVLYAMIMTYGAEVLSLITINLALPDKGFFVFRGSTLALCLLGPFFMCLCVVGVGVRVSLRAKSVRTAMQKLRVGMFVVIFIGFGLVFGGPAASRRIAESHNLHVEESASQYSSAAGTAGFLAVLAVIGLALLLYGVKRFQRHRLILE